MSIRNATATRQAISRSRVRIGEMPQLLTELSESEGLFTSREFIILTMAPQKKFG